MHGTSDDAGLRAVRRLIESGSETHLVAALQSPRPQVQATAALALTECWISEEGLSARDQLEAGSRAMEEGRNRLAESTFRMLADLHPDWCEPRFRLAQLRYCEDDHRESIRLHIEVLRRKPHHFGAWHGIALNAATNQRWRLARDAARAALEVRSDCRLCQRILAHALSRLG